MVLVALLSVVLTLTGSPHGFANADSTLTRYEQTDPHIAYSGTWSTFFTASASAGSYTRANTSGASATICFTGERLDWVAMKALSGLQSAYAGGSLSSVEFQASVERILDLRSSLAN